MNYPALIPGGSMNKSLSVENIRKTSIWLITASLLWILLSTKIKIDSSSILQSAPHAGFLAPDFTLSTLDGGEISLADFSGQPILINLWASWCGPCRAEMPAMQAMYEMYKADGFMILAINATNQDNLKDVSEFVDEFDLTFPILLDSNGDVSIAYQLQALPTSFFVDKIGIIQEVVIGGPMAEAMLETRIQTLLEEN
jgi:cytochrome c biogenesis protein CcmG, thiol:disulfide interchange protein DsbE